MLRKNRMVQLGLAAAVILAMSGLDWRRGAVRGRPRP